MTRKFFGTDGIRGRANNPTFHTTGPREGRQRFSWSGECDCSAFYKELKYSLIVWGVSSFMNDRNT